MSKVKKDQYTEGKKKDKYRVINWPQYNRALTNRGDFTLYFTAEAQEAWYEKDVDAPKQKGGQFIYSNLCIESLAMLKVVFRLPYRQLRGFAQSVLMMMGLDHLDVPSYTQICRRARALKIDLSVVRTGGTITVVIDSTGLKIYGEGEWKVRKHGVSKRRTWRKLHLGCDPETGFVHCATLTTNSVDDASQLAPLLDQVEDPIDDVCLDGAYDSEDCWDELIGRKINPIIPPRRNAVEWYWEEEGDLPDYPRNVAIQKIRQKGRKQWKEESGYHRRSLSETAMYRVKTIFGPQLYSRKFESQQTETLLKIKALNIMTAQGMPISVKVEAA